MGEERGKEAKGNVFVILVEGYFDPVGVIWAWEILDKVGRFHRGGGGEYLVIVNSRNHDGEELFKEDSMLLKVNVIRGLVSSEGDLDSGGKGGLLFVPDKLENYLLQGGLVIVEHDSVNIQEVFHR